MPKFKEAMETLITDRIKVAETKMKKLVTDKVNPFSKRLDLFDTVIKKFQTALKK